MKLQNNQKVSFNGTVKIVNLARNEQIRSQVKSDNPLLRPLIRHLKQHTNPNVKHTINIGDIQVGVSSSYEPSKKINGIDRFIRQNNIVATEPLKKEKITDLIEWSKGTKEWMKDIKQQEQSIKKQEQEAVKNTPKPSFLTRLLHRIF